MKLGVIGGAGVVGSAVAFVAAERALVDEILLYDTKDNYAANHAMDIDQGTCLISRTRTVSGEFDELESCDIIVNAAGVPASNAASRDAYLDGNIKILSGMAEKISNWSNKPIFISATNPIDVLNYSFYKMIGGSTNRFIGFSSNDTLRFKWAISLETGIDSSMIDAIVLGEHGVCQVPLFSQVKRKDTGEHIAFDEATRAKVLGRVTSWFGQVAGLNAPRTMGWTSAIGIGNIIAGIMGINDDLIPCSVIPNNEYGISDISIGLPIKLDSNGLKSIVEIAISEDEREKLMLAADTIRQKTGV